jgi:site-specific DNA recombinase
MVLRPTWYDSNTCSSTREVRTLTTPVVRCAIYCRVSLDWEGQGKGVKRQLEDCLAIAKRLGWTVVDHYIDNDTGASRYSKKKIREDYNRLLADIEAGRIDAVVIWMEDRLQRQVIELAEFLKVCDQAGVRRIASAGGEFDLSDPDQRTMLYIKAAMAEAEIEKMAKRMRRKNQERAEKGERHLGGRRPYGEAWHGTQAVSEDQAAEERELIREAVRRLIAGDSLRGIVTDWEKRGVRSQFGNLWRNTNLRRCLLSPRLVGMRAYNGELVPGDWEPIISVEEWQAVKAILEDPSRYKHEHGGLPRYLLSGLVYCGHCDARLYPRKIRGKRVYYCSPVAPKGGCGKISRQAESLEELIEGAIFRAVESDAFQRLVGQEPDDPTAPLYEQLARDQGLLDRLEDKIAQELISPATAKRNRSEIDRRMEDTRRQIARQRGGHVVAQVPRNLREVWPTLSMDRRRNIVKAVLVRLVVLPQTGGSRDFHPEKIVAEWRDQPVLARAPE